MSTDIKERVAIVDDDPTVLTSMVALISSMGWECHASASAEEFLERGLPLAPGCVVLDHVLPGMNGFDLFQNLMQRDSPPSVIFVTAFATIPMAVDVMRGGAFTLLEKPCRALELKDSIHKAILSHREIIQRSQQTRQIRERFNLLTDVERQVVHGIVQGTPNAQLAQDLKLGLRTVEKRRQQIFRKLQVDHLPALIKLLYRAAPEFMQSLPDEDFDALSA